MGKASNIFCLIYEEGCTTCPGPTCIAPLRTFSWKHVVIQVDSGLNQDLTRKALFLKSERRPQTNDNDDTRIFRGQHARDVKDLVRCNWEVWYNRSKSIRSGERKTGSRYRHDRDNRHQHDRVKRNLIDESVIDESTEHQT